MHPLLRLLALMLSLACAALSTGARAADEPPVLVKFLPGVTLEQANAALIAAIVNNNYTFVRQQSLDARLVPEALEGRQVRIVYFCNFAKMSSALNIDVRAAQVLPCRFTLTEAEGGGVNLMAINPAWVAQGWNNPLLQPDCLALKRDYLAIMDEVAL
jgi:uncharacterized protein (DUF302 family)